MARNVLDILLSSTSEDLDAHRSIVTRAIGELGQFTVRMEDFGARSASAVAICKQEVQQSDALIVIVGHRYGWVPSADAGGDSETSITWWEVRWALEADKPVYAFLIDESAPWTGPREQDRLQHVSSDSEVLEVARAVRSLQQFRRFLGEHGTWKSFANADELGRIVATSLFKWLLEQAPRRPAAGEGRLPIASFSSAAAVEPKSILMPTGTFWQEQIHLLSARELVDRSEPVRIALIAGRVREDHPALRGLTITQVDLDLRGAGADAEADDYSTSLTALLSARGGDGYVGVAPGSELLVLNVLGRGLANQADIADALDRAAIGGARVVCLGLMAREKSMILADAVLDATDSGLTIVCPAGNTGSSALMYPAALEPCIAVGTVDRFGAPTNWTQYGSWVHVAAPGDEVPTPSGHNAYTTAKGTSYSCAIVAGVAAMLLQVNTGLKPLDIRRILTSTAVGDRSGTRRAPLVNAFDAVQQALSERA